MALRAFALVLQANDLDHVGLHTVFVHMLVLVFTFSSAVVVLDCLYSLTKERTQNPEMSLNLCTSDGNF